MLHTPLHRRLSNSLTANVTRASAEAAFTPLSITGLTLWLDASDASTLYNATSGGSLVAAAGQVSRWEDKSGNARHFVQGTALQKPTRVVSSINALDVVSFAGLGQLLAANTIWPTLTAASALIVHRPTTSPLDSNILWQFGSRADASYYAYSGATHGTIYDGFGTNDRVSANASFDLDQVTNLFESTVVSATTAYWLQGAVFVPATAAVIDWASFPTIGSGVGKNSGDPGYLGRICEILIWNRAITAPERLTIRTYLASKWGITL